jgi:hypothetical protein
MDQGAQPTAEILSFKPYRLIEDAPAWADEPPKPFTRAKLAWFVALGLLSWSGLAAGLWAIFWGLIEFLKALGV